MAESFSVKAILSAVDSNFSSVFGKASSAASSLGKSTRSLTDTIKGTAIGIGIFKAVGAATSALTSHLGDAVSRYDTLNQYPRVLKQLGYSTQEAALSSNKLSDGIDGLPTTLDEVVSTSQRLTVLTGNLEKSTDTTLALNNAFLASGSSSGDAARGLQQYTQMMAKGKPDLEAWYTLQETMGYALQTVAKEFGFAGEAAQNDLYKALQNGEITFDEFNSKLIECSERTGGFAEIAKTSTTGIGTSWKNLGTAVSKGLERVIAATDTMLKNNGLPTFAEMLDKAKSAVNEFFGSYETLADGTKKFNGGIAEAIANLQDLEGVLTRLGAVVGAGGGLIELLPVVETLGSGFMETADKGRQVVGVLSSAKNRATLFGKTMSGSMEPGTKAFKNLNWESRLFVERLTGVKQILKGSFDPESAGFSKFHKSSKEFLQNVDSMKGKITRAGKSVKGFAKSVVAMIPDGVKKKATDLGDTISGAFILGKRKIQQVGDAIGMMSFKFGTATGRFEKDAPIVWKAFDGIKSKVENAAPVLEKVGAGIGTGIRKSASVGVTAMNGMVSSLTSIMGIAMSVLGPAAILGVVLAGLGVLHTQFGSQIDQMIQLVTTKGPLIINGLVNSITSALPSLIATGSQMLVGFMNAITANLPAVINGGVQIIQALVQGVSANIPVLLPAAINLIATFAGGILSAIPQLLTTGMQLLLSLSQGILSNIGLIVQSATNIIQNFTTSIMSNLPSLISMGLQILMNLAQGAIQALPQILVVGLQAIAALITGIASQLPNILQTGVQLIQMLIQGLVQNLPQILAAGLQVIQSLLTGIVQNLPTIIESGITIIASLVTGLIQMLPSIVSAGWELIKSLGSAIAEAIPNIITGAVEGIKNIFTNLWDFITGKNQEGSSKTAEDMTAMTTNVQSSMSTMSANVQGNMNMMGTNVSGSLSLMGTNTMTTMGNLSSNVQQSFASMSNGATAEAANMMTGVTGSLSGMNSLGTADMSGLANNIISSSGNANSAASSNIANMASSIDSSMSEIESSAQNSMDKLPQIAETSMNTMNNTIQSTLSQIPGIVRDAMSGFNSSLQSGLSRATSTARSGANSVVSALRSARSGAYSAGAYVSQGFASGMLSCLGTIRSAAAQMAAAAEAAVRAKAKIASPSKVTKKLGVFYGEGWVNGILSQAKEASRAALELVSIPDVSAPSLELAYSTAGGVFETNDDYNYSRKSYVYIEVPVEVEGREIARASAEYMQDELNKIERRNGRKRGRI